MTNDVKFPELRFDVSAMCYAERVLDKTMHEIIAELMSKTGARLTTLRALLAAGVCPSDGPKAPEATRGRAWSTMIESITGERSRLTLDEAGHILEEHGLTRTAEAIGKALNDAIARLTRDADLETTGEIRQLEKTVGADGKARKPSAKGKVNG